MPFFSGSMETGRIGLVQMESADARHSEFRF
jgi:hypothetical protein